ncbi:MAG: metal ABC transporter substrate-binding protein [Ottowia sp.]|jgi:D-methionine transport system substrate-binding protein|nr:metal ABC transporter substrate-binding protein [Ottowia sp.]
MSSIRRHLLVGSLAAAALLGWGSVAHAQAKKELTIGTTAGSNIEVLRRGIQPQLEKQGYKIKLVEFSDYVQPNHALAQGALDANYFQHIIYLKNFAEKNKLDLVDLVQGPIAPLGLYSKKRKSINELKEGDRIAVPNDPTNLARTFVFLEQFGLVKAKAGVDPLKVTERDIAENPKKLKFVPLEAALLPRALEDTEFSVINGNFALSSGLKLTDAVALEKTPDYYLLVAAVRSADKNTPWANDLAAAFKTPFFRDVLDKHFPGYARPASLR